MFIAYTVWQAKDSLNREADSTHGGVRFATGHEVLNGTGRSAASAGAARRAQRLDDTRTAAQEALEELLQGNKRFREVGLVDLMRRRQ